MMSSNDDLQFQLPNDQWEAATPPEGQIFMAMRKGEFRYFRPNISADVAALRRGATLEDAAQDVFARLRQFDDAAKVSQRRAEEGSPTLAQQVDFDTRVNEDTTIRLTQLQYLVEAPATGDADRAVLCFMLTAESDDIANYAEDFQAFLDSARTA